MSIVKDFINRLPDTMEILDFNLTDIIDEDTRTMHSDILEATSDPSVKLLCCCTGNRINNDWLVSNKVLYKIPYMNSDEDIHIIDMNKIGAFDLSTEVFKDLLSRNELFLCIDLGDNVLILLDLQNDEMEMIDNGERKNITIPDGPISNYTANYVRGHIIIENPYIFNYNKYYVQLGPGISLKFWKDGQQIMSFNEENDGENIN
jgi:hypothetical protein